MGNLRINISNSWGNFWLSIRNTIRRFSRLRIDYILIELAGPLPEFSPPVPRWRRFLSVLGLTSEAAPMSLQAVRTAFDQIGSDPRPTGVVLRLDALSTGWATAQSLRQAIEGLRKAGKRVVAYAADFDTVKYFIACAADEIISPPSAIWNVLGLRVEVMFLKEALRAWGIEADVIAVSPYKASLDIISRTDMSPEQRENLEHILEAQFAELLEAFSSARGLSNEELRSLIDEAPYVAERAFAAGLLDAVLYPDQLVEHLSGTQAAGHKASLVPWSSARKILLAPVRKRTGKAIGVISLQGTIVPGAGRTLPLPIPLPLIGNTQAGSDTIEQALREAEANPRIAGVVLHVDSRGGSSLASDLIWREVDRVRKKKPVVAFMGNYAASGGYYVSTNADWIVGQPLTITGSIGVVWARVATIGLLDRLRVNYVALQRGAHAGLASDPAPIPNDLREVVERMVMDVYNQFKQRVNVGRKISAEELEDLAGGRIWLGAQALERGLIDQLGNLEDAVEKAKALAGVTTDGWTPTVWILGPKTRRVPQPYPADPAGWLESLQTILHERLWLLEPFRLEIR